MRGFGGSIMKHLAYRPSPCSRAGFSRLDAIVLIGVCGFSIAMFASAVQSSRTGCGRRMTCQYSLKQIALATMQYANERQGRIPLLEDGRYGWPVALLPYLDSSALYRHLMGRPSDFDGSRDPEISRLQLKILTCPQDTSNWHQALGLSYVANAGWGRFLVDEKTEAVTESHPHSADVDWDEDGVVTAKERWLTRATGVFWRAHADGYQMTLDEIAE
ncbi:MAG TPA: DUF1559 domain-containing protein, partial [Planctomycetaceae bacterium]|nr:DUF1559 domain-containing protein [Planctomycetaceae bacterium]